MTGNGHDSGPSSASESGMSGSVPGSSTSSSSGSGPEGDETGRPTPGPDLAALSDEFDDPSSLSAWQLLHELEDREAPYRELDIGDTNPGALTVLPTTSGWYNDYDGFFLFKEVTGDFMVEAEVRAEHVDDPETGPTLPYNSAGLEIRDPQSGPQDERWITHNVGFQASFIGTEGKTTESSRSELRLVRGLHHGRLRICRVGDVFVLTRRLADEDAWTQPSYYPDRNEPARYERPDLPDTLQVGLMANGWNSTGGQPDESIEPDVRGVFEYIRFSSIESEADCLAE